MPLAHLATLLGLGNGSDHEQGYIVVLQVGSQCFGVAVDGVFHTEEIVVKPMSSRLRHITMFSGNTILGDGSVIMIVDPNGIAQAIGGTVSGQLAAAEVAESKPMESSAAETTSLLVFRAGSPHAKAVPLSLVTRLEEIDAKTIELSNGRHMIQYRGQLMPLIRMNEDVRVKGEGPQPLLVFSDGSHSMALVVDEIVDIVEDRLDIQVASDTPGVLGSAIVKGQATEIIDVGHFLPLAFEDWFRRKDRPARVERRSVLLVDDSPFFRNMLTPVLQAAGFKVAVASSAPAALEMINAGETFDVIVTDIEMPELNGYEFAEKLRADPRTAAIPVIGISSTVSAEAAEHGRRAGFHDFVAKFDRQGLIASLKEQSELDRVA